jgi:hypothetical protein
MENSINHSSGPSIVQIPCVWFVPESFRWYISKGRTEKALHVPAKVHANENANESCAIGVSGDPRHAETGEIIRRKFVGGALEDPGESSQTGNSSHCWHLLAVVGQW